MNPEQTATKEQASQTNPIPQIAPQQSFNSANPYGQKERTKIPIILLLIAAILLFAPALGFIKIVHSVLEALLGNPAVGTQGYAVVNIVTIVIWGLMLLGGLLLGVIGLVRLVKASKK